MLLHFIVDVRSSTNQIQSFDRLYRTRSESQPPRETPEEVQNIQQESTDSKQVTFFVSLFIIRSPSPSFFSASNKCSIKSYTSNPSSNVAYLHACLLE